MRKLISSLEFVTYWSIVILPFAVAIGNAPMNIFMGLIIVTFLAKKLLKREKLFQSTGINLPLLLLFLITCISIIHSVDIKDTLKGGIGRLLGFIFVFFALAQEVKDKKHISRMMVAVACALLLICLDELWQIASGTSFIRHGWAPIFNLGLARATASFKDSNTLGVYLSAITPLVLGLTLYYYKGRQKLVFIAISLLSLAGIALTYSRPTLLAIYLVFLFFGLAKKDKLLLWALVIFTLASPFLLPKAVKDWGKSVDYNPIRFMCNDDRIAVYYNSLNMIRHHPVIGVGANTFMKNYKQYKEVPEYRGVVTSDYMYAHNNFLQMAAEIGLIGLAVFLWLLYGLFAGAKSIYQGLKDNYLKIISLSLIACLIAFLVNGLTETSLYYSRVAVLFWYLAGFSLGLKRFI